MRAQIKALLIIVAILLVIRFAQEIILLPTYQKVIIQPNFTDPNVS